MLRLCITLATTGSAACGLRCYLLEAVVCIQCKLDALKHALDAAAVRSSASSSEVSCSGFNQCMSRPSCK